MFFSYVQILGLPKSTIWIHLVEWRETNRWASPFVKSVAPSTTCRHRGAIIDGVVQEWYRLTRRYWMADQIDKNRFAHIFENWACSGRAGCRGIAQAPSALFSTFQSTAQSGNGLKLFWPISFIFSVWSTMCSQQLNVRIEVLMMMLQALLTRFPRQACQKYSASGMISVEWIDYSKLRCCGVVVYRELYTYGN